MRPEELGKFKKKITSSRIEPATFRFVAYATACPLRNKQLACVILLTVTPAGNRYNSCSDNSEGRMTKAILPGLPTK
jgi:hypothetical protein